MLNAIQECLSSLADLRPRDAAAAVALGLFGVGVFFLAVAIMGG